MNVKLLGQLRHCPIALHGGKRYFALKAGVWFRRARLLMLSPFSRAYRARHQAETPLCVLYRIPEPPLTKPLIVENAGTLRKPYWA